MSELRSEEAESVFHDGQSTIVDYESFDILRTVKELKIQSAYRSFVTFPRNLAIPYT